LVIDEPEDNKRLTETGTTAAPRAAPNRF